MGVIRTPCPDCDGQIHSETFVGHTGNTRAYSNYKCIGERDLPVGTDGASFSGCGFRAKKAWDSETGEQKRKKVSSETLESWEEWKEYDEKYRED